MRHRIVTEVVIVLGVLVAAGAALAQTAGPTVEPPRSIVPVTGPSTAPGLVETARPELVSLSPRAATEGGGGVATRAAVSGQAPAAAKVVPAPGTKTVAKKTSAPKRIGKAAAGPTKAKQVTKPTPRPPAVQTVVGKPIHAAKRPSPAPAAKRAAPAPPVLPRV